VVFRLGRARSYISVSCSFPSRWWLRRSRMAVVILASPKIWASQRRQGLANQPAADAGRLIEDRPGRSAGRADHGHTLFKGPSCLDASRGDTAIQDPVDAKKGARPVRRVANQNLAVIPPTPFCPYCGPVGGIATITLIRRMTGSAYH